jgi:predicted cobalt transporter CbtA
MERLKDKSWLENKSNYLVGVGVGFMISALYFVPENGQSASRNLWWGLTGAALMIIGGIFGSMSHKRGKDGSN